MWSGCVVSFISQHRPLDLECYTTQLRSMNAWHFRWITMVSLKTLWRPLRSSYGGAFGLCPDERSLWQGWGGLVLLPRYSWWSSPFSHLPSILLQGLCREYVCPIQPRFCKNSVTIHMRKWLGKWERQATDFSQPSFLGHRMLRSSSGDVQSTTRWR
jgi:hypothetical protein